jgi:hypothetical protein
MKSSNPNPSSGTPLIALQRRWWGNAAVRLRVDDDTLVDDLCAHYRRSDFRAEAVGGGVVEIARPDVSREQERREVLMHLRVWDVLHPEARAEPV